MGSGWEPDLLELNYIELEVGIDRLLELCTGNIVATRDLCAVMFGGC